MNPTDADRAKATLVVARLPISLGDYRTRDLDAARDVIAAALAAEREAALSEAQSGLLAHRDPGVRPGDGDQFGKGWNSALNFAADWIGRQLRAAAAAPTPTGSTP